MQYATIYAFVVVAGAPLIGIWRGHVWAKANRLVLRTTATSGQNLIA
jgi:predicted MFS family arabinose efflux permease